MSERERLNAFVDGELPAAEAAALSQRLAQDPALATEVDALRRIKAGVAALSEEPPVFTFPQAAPAPVLMRRAWRLLPVAAVLCLAIGLAWTQSPDSTAETGAVAVAPAADLAAERRVMARFDFQPAPQLAAGSQERAYHGARGCVLTIIEGTRTALAARQGEGLPGQTRLWANGDTARLILARNMDSDRFAFFATLLTDLWQEADRGEERALLARAPNAAPCVG